MKPLRVPGFICIFSPKKRHPLVSVFPSPRRKTSPQGAKTLSERGILCVRASLRDRACDRACDRA